MGVIIVVVPLLATAQQRPHVIPSLVRAIFRLLAFLSFVSHLLHFHRANVAVWLGSQEVRGWDW
jgi:hypothetical protein